MQKKRLLRLSRFQKFRAFVVENAGKTQEFLTSKWSFLAILAVFFLFFFFPIDGIFFSCFPNVSGWSEAYYLTLWQVYGAIVGVSFVALFFFYEAFVARIASMYKNLEFRFRQEFFKKTLIQPLLFFNLISLVYVGIAVNIASRSFQSITLLVASILSICLLFVKAATFFEGNEMEKTRLGILRAEIVDSINAEVNRRLSTNLLLKLGEASDYLKFELLSLDEQNRKPVKLDVSERERILDVAVDRIIAKMKAANSKFYLKKVIGEIVSPKYSIVGSVPKETEDKTVNMLKKDFKLKREPARRDLQLALDDIEEQLIEAINRRSSRDLARFLEIYYQSIEEFLRTLGLYGIRYNPEQAKQGDWLNEWEPISRIQKDFFHIIEISVEAGNKEIIRYVADFISDILDLSKENDDFLIFYRFKDFWLGIYSLALDTSDKPLRDFTVDMVLRKVTEFISTHLLLHLEYSEVNEEQVRRYREYVIASLLLTEYMLKVALEKKALATFMEVDKNLSEISDIYDPEGHRPYPVEIETRLMDTTLGSGEKKQLNEILRIAKEKIQFKHDIDRLIREIWLGLGGWISELYAKDKLSKEEITQFLKCALAHFKDMKNLSSAYTEATSLSGRFPHAWHWWELEDKPRIVTFGLNEEEWLTRFYCLAGLIMTPNKISATDSMEPTPSSETALNAVRGQCQNILGNYDKWSSVIDGVSSSELAVKAENFIKLHERAAEKQQVIESKWLIDQPLDEEKIAEFKTKVTNGWKASSEIRGIFEKLGNHVDKTTVPEDIKIFGLQIFVPKEAFVKQPTTIVGGNEEFGQSIGRGENEVVASRILAACTASETDTENAYTEKILRLVNQMKGNGYTPNVILVGSWKVIRDLQKTKAFQPKWAKKVADIDIPGFEGYLSELPVFMLTELNKNIICISDLRKIGTFTQFRVQKDDKDALHFDIKFIDEKTAKEYMENNPKLCENEKGEKLPENEVLNNLQKRVFVKILERFEFTIEDNHACTVLRTQSANDAKS